MKEKRESSTPSLCRRIAEVLIVLICLILIFGVLLLPYSPRIARNSANRISCVNNLRQVGVALQQYMQDYDEKYPYLVNGKAENGKDNSWRTAIGKYLQDPEVWRCRGNNASSTMNPFDGLAQGYDVVDTGPIRRDEAVSWSQLKSPMTTIVAFEEDGVNPQSLRLGVPWDKDDGSKNWTRTVFSGHLESGNFLFADGRVKSLRPLTTIQRHNMWNIDNKAPISARARKKVEVAQDRALKGFG